MVTPLAGWIDASRRPKARGALLAVSRVMGAMASLFALAGILWILAVMAAMNIDIFGRYLFNAPLTGTPEFVTVSVSALVFLLLPQTVFEGRLTQVTLLLDIVRRRSPRAAGLIDRLYLLLAAAVYLTLAYYMFPKLTQAWTRGAFVGAEGVFRFPEWPVFAVICAGSAAAALASVVRLFVPLAPDGGETHNDAA